MSNPIGDLEAIATNSLWRDPAIPADCDLTKYRETRDLADISLRESPKPTLFVLSPIKASAIAGLSSPSISAQSRYAIAFLRSCHLVKLPDGRCLQPSAFEGLGPQGRFAEESWIEEITAEFGYETVQEMGRVAYERAWLPRAARGPFTYRDGWALRL